MAFDLPLDYIVRAGSGLLEIFVGILVIAAKPRHKVNVLVGIVALEFGVGWLLSNVTVQGTDLYGILQGITGVAVLGGSVALVLVFRIAVRQSSARARRWMFGVLALDAILAGSVVVAFFHDPGRFATSDGVPARMAALDFASILSFYSFVVPMGALAVGASEMSREGQPAAASWLWLTMPFLLAINVNWGITMAAVAGGPTLIAQDPAYQFAAATALAVGPICALLQVRGAAGSAGRLARNSALAGLAFALAVLMLGATPQFGVFLGIANILAIVPLAYALFRGYLFGAGFKSSTAARSAAATAGLAALFITAQIAQNFLSAKYGLYLGGIVAGAVVFAAFPLQKAAERAVDRRRRESGGADSPAAKYRRLVETAWQDGMLGANERLLLSESMRMLGVDAETAHGIDDEVARQHSARGRRPA